MLDSLLDNPVATAGMLSALGALLVLFVTELVRRTGIEAKYIVAVGCMLVGLMYAGFEAAVPPAAREAIISFVLRVAGLQWALYEYVWKNWREKLIARGAAGFRNV